MSFDFSEKIGWSADHPNVHTTTDEPNLTVFMPEGVEETHVVRYFDPKGFVHEHLIESQMFEPEGVGAEMDVKPYTLTINHTIPVPMDPVFETHPDRNVQKYAKNAKFSDDMAVFHNAKKVNIPLEPQGTLELELDGKRMVGHYELPESGSANMYAQDRMGNKAIITFTNGAITNIDFGVEIGEVVPTSPISTPFKCDASDIDHVTGLVMALEDKMASGELENMEHHFNIINAHREALEKNMDIVPGPKVNASVHTVTSALWNQHIGGLASKFRRAKTAWGASRDKSKNFDKNIKAIPNLSNSNLITQFERQVEIAERKRTGGGTGEDNLTLLNALKSEIEKREQDITSGFQPTEEYYLYEERYRNLDTTRGTAFRGRVKQGFDNRKAQSQRDAQLRQAKKAEEEQRTQEALARRNKKSLNQNTKKLLNEEEEQDVPAMAARRYK